MAKYLVFWSIALLIFVVDRISKLLILYVSTPIDLKLFSLTQVMNKGTIFGLGKSASLLLTLFTAAVILYLILQYRKYPKLQLPLGLVLGGALGNFVDRLWYGAVIDFIDIHFWPVFNIADAAITVAVVLLLIKESVKRKV